jgi:hypothetical protein
MRLVTGTDLHKIVDELETRRQSHNLMPGSDEASKVEIQPKIQPEVGAISAARRWIFTSVWVD